MNSIFYVLFLAITQKIQFKYSLNYQKYEKSIKCNNAQKKKPFKPRWNQFQQ